MHERDAREMIRRLSQEAAAYYLVPNPNVLPETMRAFCLGRLAEKADRIISFMALLPECTDGA